MSTRSFKRDRARAEAAEHRREARRARRASLAAGAAIGATVVFAPSASAATFDVDSLADGPADTCAVGDCTLRDAVEDANANAGADTITFADGLSGTITLTEGDLDVFDEAGLNITDAGTNQVTISGDADDSGDPSAGDSRIFFLDYYAQLDLTGLDLTEGFADAENKYDSSGGLILSTYESELSVTDSTLTDGYAGYGGGGIFNAGGAVTITSSEISGNESGTGGGIHSSGEKYDGGPPDLDGTDAAGEASVVITGSTVTGNFADLGGGVFSSGAKYDEEPANPALTTLEVNDSSISGNGAGSGGGTFSKYSDTTVTASEVSGNEAASAAGLGAFLGNLAISDSEISGNIADSAGGGIGVGKYGTLDITASDVVDNDAGYGGGIIFGGGPDDSDFKYAEPGSSTIAATTIAGNTAHGSGAGIEIDDVVAGEELAIESTTISGNRAVPDGEGEKTYGGGISVYGAIAGDVLLSNSTVSGNSASFGGGVAFDSPPYVGPGPDASADSIPEGGSVRLDNSTIAANDATDSGGGIYIGSYDSDPSPEGNYASVTVPLSSTVVADNTAGGGASANDLAQTTQVDTPGGGFRLTNSLVEAPGSATVDQSPAGSSILGVDPQLGALADNGGPTLTQLPSVTSPVLDAGLANGLSVDQRGLPRTVDVAADNGAGDGTDIGSVEVQNTPNPHVRALERSEVPVGCEVPFDDAALALAGDNTSQTIEGGPGDDILRGYGGEDTVLGVGGDDCLTGDSDDDVVEGGDGDDFAIGGFGDDLVKGGKGDDEMRGAEDEDKIKLAGGDDKGVGGGGEDRVTGGGGDDAVRGRFGADVVKGDNGDDAVRGGGGDDKVAGGSGANALRGGGGDDVILLAKGSSNEVNCGKGTDVVKGATKDDEIAPNCEKVK